jgi:hypothetical protein
MYNKNLVNSNKYQTIIVGLRNEIKILLSKIDRLSEKINN